MYNELISIKEDGSMKTKNLVDNDYISYLSMFIRVCEMKKRMIQALKFVCEHDRRTRKILSMREEHMDGRQDHWIR